MYKFFCCLLLAATAVVAIAADPPFDPARQKEKRDDDSKKEGMKLKPGTVQLYQASDGWRFRVLDADGKLIAIGVQGYSDKDECRTAAELLIESLANAKITEQKKDEKKKDEKKKDEKKKDEKK